MTVFTVIFALCAAAKPEADALESPGARTIAVPAEQQPADDATKEQSTPAAPAFRLEDQFGESHSVSYPLDRPVVFVLADREGSRQVDDWVRWLVDVYGDRVAVYGVARLEGVPRALRSTVKFLFKREVAHPVLLDWTGEITDQFQFKPGAACIVVADPTGAIMGNAYGAWTEAGGKLIGRAIETALPQDDAQSEDAAP